MQPAEIALLDMFSHGKSKISPLLNSLWCNIQKCLHYKVLCTTLGGVPKFLRTVNEKIEPL